MLFASIFLSLDYREVLTLDLYHGVEFAKTSKPLQPPSVFFHYTHCFCKVVNRSNPNRNADSPRMIRNMTRPIVQA